jgi:gas vesicle protein
MSAKNILIAAMSGLTAGIAIGLLTAPAKGSETRHKISDGAVSLKNKFKKLTGKAESELDELKDIFQNEIDGLGDDVRERVLKLIASTKASYNHVKEEVIS